MGWVQNPRHSARARAGACTGRGDPTTVTTAAALRQTARRGNRGGPRVGRGVAVARNARGPDGSPGKKLERDSMEEARRPLGLWQAVRNRSVPIPSTVDAEEIYIN